jgi:hypothetical protein
MAYLGANIYSYTSSGVAGTYNRGDIVADSATQVYGTVAAAAAGATQLTLTAAAGTPVAGMVISSLAGIGIPSGTTITAVSGSGPYTITLSQPLAIAVAASTKVGAATYWISNVDANVGNAPASSPAYWTATVTPYTWVQDGTNWALTTDSIKTETHDKFVGTVFHTGAASDLYIQQSADNKNWDYTSAAVTTVATGALPIDTRYGTLAGFSAKFTEEVVSPYIRLKFVYKTTLPTAFRLNARTSDSGVKY